MKMHQAYRLALDPTVQQRRALASHCGAARFAFNFGLRLVKRTLDAREWERRLLGGALTESLSWSLAALRREWNRQKDEVAPWWPENSKEAYSSGLDALARALRAWSDSREGERVGAPVGFPRFRKRGHRESCRFTTGVIRVDDERHVSLPRMGRLRTCEATTALAARLQAGSARILSATVSREADRWFVSFTCEVERAVPAGNGHDDVIGVDLGVLRLATLSTGEVIDGPKALRRSGRKLRRLQRAVSRRCKGSARRGRARRQLARAHRRVADLRKDCLHKLTTRLAKSHGSVVVEDLNVHGMTRSARGSVEEPGRNVRAKAGLNRALLDAGFGELRRQLAYKCPGYGSRLVLADRFFASSKRCSGCGAVRVRLRLSERAYRCSDCGLVLDRDLNAALNLVWWAETQRLRPHVAASAAETQNGRQGGRAIRSRAGDVLDAAATGDVPEPAGSTGGPQQRVSYVRS